MNKADINHVFLKAVGLILLLLGTYAAAQALGAIASLAYWITTRPPGTADAFEWISRQMKMSLFANILQAIMLWWAGLQVLKEKPWILKLTRINIESPDARKNVPGVSSNE